MVGIVKGHWSLTCSRNQSASSVFSQAPSSLTTCNCHGLSTFLTIYFQAPSVDPQMWDLPSHISSAGLRCDSTVFTAKLRLALYRFTSASLSSNLLILQGLLGVSMKVPVSSPWPHVYWTHTMFPVLCWAAEGRGRRRWKPTISILPKSQTRQKTDGNKWPDSAADGARAAVIL